jgi:hypothetical protein
MVSEASGPLDFIVSSRFCCPGAMPARGSAATGKRLTHTASRTIDNGMATARNELFLVIGFFMLLLLWFAI